MNQDQDYDSEGNNIVPCPICLDVYCPSKEDGKCPQEDEYAASFDTMPKDYQEVERIVDIIDDILFKYDLEYMSSPAREEIVAILTTFSNARELAGIEKVEKGVPAMNAESWDQEYRAGYRKARQATLDHIAKVKSEIK